jgi:hypothetical protein
MRVICREIPHTKYYNQTIYTIKARSLYISSNKQHLIRRDLYRIYVSCAHRVLDGLDVIRTIVYVYYSNLQLNAPDTCQ